MASEAPKSPYIQDGTVEFHYQKTALYRGLHVDGFWGGPTPRGALAISFFHERQPIPKHARRKLIEETEGGAVMGPEEVTEVLPGVVRQVENTVYMDVKVAQELYTWLGRQVAAMEEAFDIPADERVVKVEGK